MIKDDLIKNIHALMRNDSFILELFTSAGLSMDNIESTMLDMEKQYWFDTITWGINKWESLLAITTPESLIENRRSLIEAKWKSDSKADLYLLQMIADSWQNGKIEVKFTDGKIEVIFADGIGTPTDLPNLKKALEDVKPAHLAILYSFAYLTWGVLDSRNITWGELDAKHLTWGEFEIGAW